LTRVLAPRGALTLHQVDGALLFALRAALAMALPASALVFSGRTALAVYPMLGASTTTFGRNLPYRRRAHVLGVADSLLGTIRQAADAGNFVAKFHFSGTIDDTVGGSGSQRALSALAAASDVGQRKFVDYLATLFAAQPFPLADDQFADVSVLLSLADKVRGLRNAEFDRKVTDDTYLTWAGEVIGDFESFGVVGTPVVRYDDEVIPVVKPEGGPAITPPRSS
jgi:hypothetical protein